MRHVWQTVRDRLVFRPAGAVEDWSHLPADASSTSCLDAYYPPEELERLRESTARAAVRSASFIAAELEKARLRQGRRNARKQRGMG